MVVNEFHLPDVQHHSIYVDESAVPLKVVRSNNIVTLYMRGNSVGGGVRTMRISRYPSFAQIPDNAFYIDTITLNGMAFHYFELGEV